jgi:hypothetical protein
VEELDLVVNLNCSRRHLLLCRRFPFVQNS